jgi:hypothetical protein
MSNPDEPIDEVDSEHRWEEMFARSHELLERLAAEAIEEFHRGETEPLHTDDL